MKFKYQRLSSQSVVEAIYLKNGLTLGFACAWLYFCLSAHVCFVLFPPLEEVDVAKHSYLFSVFLSWIIVLSLLA